MTTTKVDYSQDKSHDKVRVHAFISGKVQGVGYRASTWDTATLLKLNGWVRNLRDGRVEAVFEGSADVVEEMIRWCHQGPPTATVADVSVEFEPPEGLRGFQVTR
ncbi:MAG: acylphosphatase [Oculatellaceae cyanobacterium bins.114]|nr:acylphosphatase [Oculatellaceae cyanobacterium bins.114]